MPRNVQTRRDLPRNGPPETESIASWGTFTMSRARVLARPDALDHFPQRRPPELIIIQLPKRGGQLPAELAHAAPNQLEAAAGAGAQIWAADLQRVVCRAPTHTSRVPAEFDRLRRRRRSQL